MPFELFPFKNGKFQPQRSGIFTKQIHDIEDYQHEKNQPIRRDGEPLSQADFSLPFFKACEIECRCTVSIVPLYRQPGTNAKIVPRSDLRLINMIPAAATGQVSPSHADEKNQATRRSPHP